MDIIISQKISGVKFYGPRILGIPLLTQIQPSANEFYITTNFRKEVGYIIHDPKDPNNKTKSIIFRGWYKTVGQVKLQWTELVQSKKAAEQARCKDDPEKSKYSAIIEFEDDPRVIGVRDEYVNLRRHEFHPLRVRIQATDNSIWDVVVMIRYHIDNPLLVLNLDDGLINYTTTMVQEVFRKWATKEVEGKKELKRTYDDILALSSTDTAAAGEICDEIDKINRDLEQDGYTITLLSIPFVSETKESKETIGKSRVEITTSANAIKVAENRKAATVHDAKAQRALDKVELMFRKEDAVIKETLIQNTSEHLAKPNAAWAKDNTLRTLVITGNQALNLSHLVSGSLESGDFAETEEDKKRKRNKIDPKKPKT
jgi:hypothetical protein